MMDNVVVIYRQDDIFDVYDVQHELGRGQFAVVKHCISKHDKKPAAGKFIKLKRNHSSRKGLCRQMVEREASILSAVHHEKIITLYDVFDLKTEIALMLELVCGGELFDKICENEYITEIVACRYVKQVLEAIDHIHQLNIVHLDIKPENIVLKSKDSSDIKLVDFGLAQHITPGKEVREIMGTAEFVAPEIVGYEPIGCYTDMWAIGVLTFILLSGCSPFLGESNQETLENISRGEYFFDEETFDNISEESQDFISNLLVKQTKKRNTADQCLSHQWLQDMLTPRDDDRLITTARLKEYLAKRRWLGSFQKLNAVSKFTKMSKSPYVDNATESPNVYSLTKSLSLPSSKNVINDNSHESEEEEI